MKYLTKTDIVSGCDFCSQMSQYATLKSVAKDLGFEVIFIPDNIQGGYSYHLDKCFTHIPLIYNSSIGMITINNIPWDGLLANFLPSNEEINYNVLSDISNYKNFHHNRELIFEIYNFTDDIKIQGDSYLNSIRDENEEIISVHFRRGDYLRISSLNLTLDYYKEASTVIEEKLKYKKIKYLCFSNDIEWVRQNFIRENIEYCNLNNRYVELYIQTICDHNIIANSSYSWWGAYLNKSKQKITICPMKYTGGPPIDNNYYPNDWLALDKA